VSDGEGVVVSFDIDGTMEFGHPPGPVTVERVRGLAADGHVVGSASDRTRGDQQTLWAVHGVEVAFIGGKHHLDDVRSRFPAARHVHIGDGHVDEHYAKLAGFEFVHVDELHTFDL
jgi:hypothetical protein